MPAYCANERLGYKNDYVSWSHFLVGQLFGKKKTAKMKKKKKKKKRPVEPDGLWQFSLCCLHSQGIQRRAF